MKCRKQVLSILWTTPSGMSLCSIGWIPRQRLVPFRNQSYYILYVLSVYVDCLALSICSDFWLRWLLHEAWHGIRVHGLEFRVLAFAIYPKNCYCPPLPSSESTYMPLELYLRVSTCWLVSRHTWGGVLSVYVDCLALSISSDFWLRWLLREAWQYAFALLSRQCLQAVCDMNRRNRSKVPFHQTTGSRSYETHLGILVRTQTQHKRQWMLLMYV